MAKGEDRFRFYLGIYILQQAACVLLLVGFQSVGGVLLTPMAGSKMHRRSLRTLMSAPLSYFTSVDAGVTTNHFSQDFAVIDGDLAHGLTNFLITLFVVLGGAVVVGASSPYLLVAYPFVIGLICAIQFVYLRTSRQLRLLELEASAPLYTHFLETLNGLVTIRAFGWTEQSIALSNRRFDHSQQADYLFRVLQLWLAMVLSMTSGSLAILFVVLATQVQMQEAVSRVSVS